MRPISEDRPSTLAVWRPHSPRHTPFSITESNPIHGRIPAVVQNCTGAWRRIMRPSFSARFQGKDCTQIMEHLDRPVVGKKIKLKGGEMEFVVFRVDYAAQIVDLTPAEQGFSVARNVPFDHIQRNPEKDG